MKKMKKFAALLLAVSMAAGMVACGSSDKKEETTKKEETKKDDKETKKLEGTLKVVTTGDAYQPLFDKFTEEVGPKVEFISMSSGEVLSKLKAEGGTPAADLWFGGGIDAFMDAKDNDLLERIAADPAFNLSVDELKKTMDPSKYVGRAPVQVDNYLNNVVRPMLEENKEILGMTAEINV